MVSFLISRNSKQNITIMITIPDFNLILEDDQKDEFISFWLSIIGSRLLLSRTDRLQCESKHFEQLRRNDKTVSHNDVNILSLQPTSEISSPAGNCVHIDAIFLYSLFVWLTIARGGHY